jgi:predicted Zn-dependent protease
MHDQSTDERIVEIEPAFLAFVEGRVSFAQFLGLDPDALARLLHLAIAQLQVGRFADAISIIEGLIALDDQNYVFHQYLGLARERSKDYEGAVAAYDDMLARVLGREERAVEQVEGFLLRARAHAVLSHIELTAKDLVRAQGLSVEDRELGEMTAELARMLGGAP